MQAVQHGNQGFAPKGATTTLCRSLPSSHLAASILADATRASLFQLANLRMPGPRETGTGADLACIFLNCRCLAR